VPAARCWSIFGEPDSWRAPTRSGRGNIRERIGGEQHETGPAPGSMAPRSATPKCRQGTDREPIESGQIDNDLDVVSAGGGSLRREPPRDGQARAR
jgi:hypothetical protein